MQFLRKRGFRVLFGELHLLLYTLLMLPNLGLAYVNRGEELDGTSLSTPYTLGM